MGLAILEKHLNRTELVGWNDLSGEWPKDEHIAFAVILPEALPMEFPTNGADLFREFEKVGMVRERIVKNLGLAALLTPDGEPIHLVLGLPMRRAADGSKLIHIAVWTTDGVVAKSLRTALPKVADTEEIRTIREELINILASIFEQSKIKWCQVLEGRSEIITSRDSGTPASWFVGKKILILGCGALGSWTAEIASRARANLIHIVDNSIVKPGVLARQNFVLQDIGANKAIALTRRLSAIAHDSTIVPYAREAHAFVTEENERLQNYDVVLDCTASSIFQMKVERDWTRFAGRTPPFISILIDSQAKHCLCVVTPKNSTGGVWDSYLSLKMKLCIEGSRPALTSAFYSPRAAQMMFQPEPGCSDPTFTGSTADVFGLISGALNIALSNLQIGNPGVGIALSAPEATGCGCGVALDSVEPPRFCEAIAGNYRVRIAVSIFTKARAWVRQNNRFRSPDHETGGLLWGVWDDAVQVIWIFDLSGPPPDSQHNPAHFICGVEGTLEEHKRRMARTYEACDFVGHWHTHPDFPSRQSVTDMENMAALVSSIGQNQKRSTMLIFGRTGGLPTAGIYVYESQSLSAGREGILVGMSQITLESAVV